MMSRRAAVKSSMGWLRARRRALASCITPRVLMSPMRPCTLCICIKTLCCSLLSVPCGQQAADRVDQQLSFAGWLCRKVRCFALCRLQRWAPAGSAGPAEEGRRRSQVPVQGVCEALPRPQCRQRSAPLRVPRPGCGCGRRTCPLTCDGAQFACFIYRKQR